MATTLVDKKFKLKGLSIGKVSLVPKGANPESHVTLFKADRRDHFAARLPNGQLVLRVKDDRGKYDKGLIKQAFKEFKTIGPKMGKLNRSATRLILRKAATEAGLKLKPVKKTTFNDIRSARLMRAAIYEVTSSCYDMQDAIYSSIYNGEYSDVKKSIGQFQDYVGGLLDQIESGAYAKEDPSITREELVEKGEALLETLKTEEPVKKKAATAKVAKKVEKAKTIDEMTPEELKAYAKGLETKLAKSSDDDDDEDGEGDEGESEDDEDDSFMKSLPAPAQARIRKAEARAAEALALAKAAQVKAGKEEELRVKKEYVARARVEFAHLPGTAEENGALLYDLYKTMPKEMADKVVAKMRSGDAANAPMFEEAGRADADEGTAAERVEKRAKALAKKKHWTYHKAYDFILRKNPNLYKEIRQEQRRAVHAE